MVDWEQKKSKNKFLLLNLEVRRTELKAWLANQSTWVNTQNHSKTGVRAWIMYQGISVETTCHDSCRYQKMGLLYSSLRAAAPWDCWEAEARIAERGSLSKSWEGFLLRAGSSCTLIACKPRVLVGTWQVPKLFVISLYWGLSLCLCGTFNSCALQSLLASKRIVIELFLPLICVSIYSLCNCLEQWTAGAYQLS